MNNLDTFTRAYIEAALWSSTDNATPQGGEPLDKNYSASDIAPEAMARIVSDCAKFQVDHGETLGRAYVTGNGDDYGVAQAGHDFWLTRNGHGAGFWDRGLEDVGAALTAAAHAVPFGSCDLYVGDDGKLYLA